jgi:hypothetical protein
MPACSWSCRANPPSARNGASRSGPIIGRYFNKSDRKALLALRKYVPQNCQTMFSIVMRELDVVSCRLKRPAVDLSLQPVPLQKK